MSNQINLNVRELVNLNLWQNAFSVVGPEIITVGRPAQIFNLWFISFIPSTLHVLHDWPLYRLPILSFSFQNIVLSGGSTMFKDFHRRLQRDIKKIVDARVLAAEARLNGEIKVRVNGYFYWDWRSHEKFLYKPCLQ